MSAGRDTTTDIDALRKRGARRTAMLLGAVVVAVYLGFLLTGVVGR